MEGQQQQQQQLQQLYLRGRNGSFHIRYLFSYKKKKLLTNKVLA